MTLLCILAIYVYYTYTPRMHINNLILRPSSLGLQVTFWICIITKYSYVRHIHCPRIYTKHPSFYPYSALQI